MGEVIGAVTLWLLFSAWLFLPRVRAPRALCRTVAVLAWLELGALLAVGYGGGALVRAAAFEEVPGFSLAVLGAGAVYGLRIGRRTPG